MPPLESPACCHLRLTWWCRWGFTRRLPRRFTRGAQRGARNEWTVEQSLHCAQYTQRRPSYALAVPGAAPLCHKRRGIGFRRRSRCSQRGRQAAMIRPAQPAGLRSDPRAPTRASLLLREKVQQTVAEEPGGSSAGRVTIARLWLQVRETVSLGVRRPLPALRGTATGDVRNRQYVSACTPLGAEGPNLPLLWRSRSCGTPASRSPSI